MTTPADRGGRERGIVRAWTSAVAFACVATAMVIGAAHAAAAPGDLDTSFASGGFDTSGLLGAEPLPDGDVYVYGAFQFYGGAAPIDQEQHGIIRLDPTGARDLTFDMDGTGLDTDGSLKYVSDIAVLPDGDIVAVGTFTSYNGTTQEGIARLNPDGSLDTTLVSTSGGFSCQTPGGASGCPANPSSSQLGPRAVVVLPGGDLLVAGGFDHYESAAVNNVVRINPNGSRDTGFDPGTGTDGPIRALALESGGGTALIGGLFNGYDTGPKTQYLARIDTATGEPASPDLVQGTGFDASVDSLAVREDGEIIVGGAFKRYNSGTDNRLKIALLQPNGQLAAGSVDPSVPAAVVVQALAIGQDGKALAGLNLNVDPVASQKSPFRLLTDGAIDPAFGSGVGVGGNNPRLTALSPAADGSVWVTGSFTQYDGQPDPLVDVSANYVIKVLNVRELEVARTGSGSVTSTPAGISCGSTCRDWFDQASTVSLKANPAPGFKLAKWGGACSGTGSCSVTLDEGESVTATFAKLPAKPRVKWTSSKRKRTVKAQVTRVTGVTYKFTAKKGKATRTGTCRVNAKTKKLDCTAKLRKGRWLASVTPTSSGLVGPAATKTFRFR